MSGIVGSQLMHFVIKAGTLTLILIIQVSLVADTRIQGSSMTFNGILITLYLFAIINNALVLIPHNVGYGEFTGGLMSWVGTAVPSLELILPRKKLMGYA